MNVQELVQDYLTRARVRLTIMEYCVEKKEWPDAIEEAQEAIDLVLRAYLRACNLTIHYNRELSEVVNDYSDVLWPLSDQEISHLVSLARTIGKEWQFARYENHDITPAEFYSEGDARFALDEAKWAVSTIEKALHVGAAFAH